MCPECKRGYFWNSDLQKCRPCNTAHGLEQCTNCPTAERCIECAQPYFPNYLQTSCQLPITNCFIPSHDLYRNDGTQFVCQKCVEGWFPEEGHCSKCQIPGCKQCLTATECAVCVLPQRFDVTGKFCIDPIEDCISDPQDYEIDFNKTSRFMCPECKENYLWNHYKEVGECEECGEVIEGCTVCTQTPQEEPNICLECEDEMIPTYDGEECMEHIENCNITDGLDSYFIKNNMYGCLECNEGYIWDQENLNCTTCDEIDHCTACQHDSHGNIVCTQCEDPDYMPSFDMKECQRRIYNCAVPYNVQPSGLDPHPNGLDWVCPQCAKVFYRDMT